MNLDWILVLKVIKESFELYDVNYISKQQFNEFHDSKMFYYIFYLTSLTVLRNEILKFIGLHASHTPKKGMQT